MIPWFCSPDSRASIHQPLLQAVPPGAMRILEVGCGEGRLGQALKLLHPQRTVFGIEQDSDLAAKAQPVLDQVCSVDPAIDLPPLDAGSLDCIVFDRVLSTFVDPEAVLHRYRSLLQPEGCILCTIPNLQHHSVLRGLLRGDFQYQPQGILASNHLRFFTWSTVMKMLLDTGFAPRLLHRT